jgi:hypothetical protein
MRAIAAAQAGNMEAAQQIMRELANAAQQPAGDMVYSGGRISG